MDSETKELLHGWRSLETTEEKTLTDGGRKRSKR